MRSPVAAAVLALPVLLGCNTDRRPTAPERPTALASVAASRSPGHPVIGAETRPLRAALRAAKGREVGTLQLWVDGARLHGRVSAAGLMSEIQLQVAREYAGLPTTRSGNPVPGRFGRKVAPTDPVTSWAFDVALAELGVAPGDEVFAALHAVVGGSSAWAGDVEFPGANWATYLIGVVNRPPTAAFSARAAERPLAVEVDASASADPDGDALTYHWSFGDNTESTHGPTTQHVYAAPGTYVITLAVTDDYGARASASSTFTAKGPSVAQVRVRPTSFGILIGDTVTLTATPTDAAGSPITGLAATWGPPSASVVSVSAAGLVTGLARGFVSVPATVEDVTGRATLSVYSTAVLDSVSFTFLTSGGSTIGWTETTQPVGRSNCVRLFTFDPNNITVALRWEPAVSDSTVMAVDRQEGLPQSHCFRALKPGTVTVLGSFGGKTARKSITIE